MIKKLNSGKKRAPPELVVYKLGKSSSRYHRVNVKALTEGLLLTGELWNKEFFIAGIRRKIPVRSRKGNTFIIATPPIKPENVWLKFHDTYAGVQKPYIIDNWGEMLRRW